MVDANEPMEPSDDIYLSPVEAAALLEVEPDRIEVMVEDGVLTPVEGADRPTFRRSEVLAVRLEGG